MVRWNRPQDEESKDTMCAYFDSVAPPQFRRRYLNSGLYAGRVRIDFRAISREFR